MSLIKTIKEPSSCFISTMGSKFYGHAYPILHKDEVKTKIEELKLSHPKANHFCTAFSIGKGDKKYHLTNDDGEPMHSAGTPILGQINSFGLSNVLIVVIRYFGGTKLGIRGLINAYKEAAKSAIENAIIYNVKSKSRFSFSTNYEKIGAVLSIIDKNNLNADIEHQNEKVNIKVTVDEENLSNSLELFQAQQLKILIN